MTDFNIIMMGVKQTQDRLLPTWKRKVHPMIWCLNMKCILCGNVVE